MRLTEPVYSIIAVSLVLIASAAAIPVLAYEVDPESAVIQRPQQAQYNLTRSHKDRGCQDGAIQETNDTIYNLQRATKY